MIQIHWSWRTSDGRRLYGRTWQPVQPKASVLLIHGLSDHIDRYHDLAQYLCERGYRIVGYDQRGHGRSSGLRGYTPSIQRLLDDLSEIWHEHLSQAPRRFLYGHSLGGCIALNAAMCTAIRSQLDGLIASSPLLRPARPIPRWKEWAAKLLNPIVPWLRFSTAVDPAELTHDPRAIEELRRDPFWHRRVSARLGVEMLRAAEWVYQNPSLLTVPTLMLHGDQDFLTSLQACREFCNANRRFCQLKEFPGMRHELHHESGSIIVWETMADWLDDQLDAATQNPSESVEKV